MEHVGEVRVVRSGRRPSAGLVALLIALVLGAVAGVMWPEIATELRQNGLSDPTRVVTSIGGLLLLAASVPMVLGALRNSGRRRAGLIVAALGADVLGLATIAMAFGSAPTIGVITTSGPTTWQVVGITMMAVGVCTAPSTVRWDLAMATDAALVLSALVSLTWLTPVRTRSGPSGGIGDVFGRSPVAALLLLGAMAAGVLYIVRTVQSSRPGDVALAASMLTVPSAIYTSLVGQLADPGSPAVRAATLWWLTGPTIFLLAAVQIVRGRDDTTAEAPAGTADATERERSDTHRARVVAAIAVLLTLSAVATHRLFIKQLDPVMMGLGVVTVLLTTARLAQLQDEQGRLQERLVTLADELHQRARTDELTGLANRLALTERLDGVLGADEMVDVFYADVDEFKNVNDALGHEVGDQLLVETARRLTRVFGPDVYRVGGDEFVAVLPTIDRRGSADRARQMVEAAREPIDADGLAVSARLSIGLAHSGGGRTGDEVLRMADLALNRAKELGRNQFAVYDSWLQDRADRRLAVQQGLRPAVDGDEFEVLYRPVVDVLSGRTVGAEAWVRWHAGADRVLHPDEYFEIAADTGLVPAISRSNLRLVIRPWAGPERPDMPLTINLTLQELAHGGLLDDLERSIEPTLDGRRDLVRLQIAEAALMDPASQRTVDRLIDHGYQLCVRDFGTAASSLRRLASFPDPTIRVDRSFTKGLDLPGSDRTILDAVVRLGRQLGITIVADGVGQPAQLGHLRDMGVAQGQGRLFGPPTPWSRFATEHLSTHLPRASAATHGAVS